MKIKDDLNFLKNPNWIVSKRDALKKFTIYKKVGSYQIVTDIALGLPVKLDKTILYFLKHKLFNENNLNSFELDTTRYEIAKSIFMKCNSFSQDKYQRIMQSLEKWQAIRLYFDKSFYEKNEYINKSFSIIHDFKISDNKKLTIQFDPLYVEQLRLSGFCKMLDFTEYRLITSPVAARLYEFLLKHFAESHVFYMDIKKLAYYLTIQKKDYESQILATIIPAIEEINNNTSLKISFQYEKHLSLCIFKKELDRQ